MPYHSDRRDRLRDTAARAGAVLACLWLAACGGPGPMPGAPGAAPAAAVPSPPLRRGLGGEVATLDPHRVGDTYSEQIARDLYEGLTSHAADGRIEPALAREWSTSADGLVWTFRLRPDARWSNGDPVTAEDVVAGLRRALTPTTASPAADALKIVAGAEAVLRGAAAPETLGVAAPDAATVVITLSTPAPYLLDMLTAPVAFPLHRPSVQANGELATAPGALVTNGAYLLDSIVPGDRVRLVRNPRWRAADSVAVPVVEYLTLADVEAELRRYRAGELDLTSTLPAGRLEWARAEHPTELQLAPTQAVAYVTFDLTEGPLRDPRLREALALALDREALVEKILRAGQKPWYSMVAPGLGGYQPASYPWAGEPRAARLARARALYRAAGHGPQRPLRLRVLHHQNENNRNAALAAGALWAQELGVEVEFDEREFRSFLAQRRERGRWDVMVTAVAADFQDPATFLAAFRSGHPDNDAGHADPVFDATLAEARAEPELARRHELYRAAESRLLAAYASTPTYVIVARRLVAPRVEGAVLTPLNRTYTRHLRLRPPTAGSRDGRG